ncbi:MAG: hypothetical protein M3O50_08390 [Myxococcota bacterium]|nr:hypothetical protein [Myxococcota bacterium]
MRTPIGPPLRDEAARYSFRFSCDYCAHVAISGRAAVIAPSERVSDPDARCSLGYPPAPRHSALFDEGWPEHRGETHLELCKSFELG